MRTILVSLIFCLSGVAYAAPVTWTLNGIVLNNGGVMSGSFDYDADTDSMSNVNIVSTAYGDDFVVNDDNIAGGGYCPEAVCYVAGVELGVPTGPGAGRDIGFYLDAPLTNAGGTIRINTVFDVLVIDYYPESEVNLAADANATISAVPVPTAIWLFGSALAALGWLRRGRSA